MQVGRLWTSLADYYIRRGLIEKARDVYEEGLTTVTTVRDFSLIFDTLTQVSTGGCVSLFCRHAALPLYCVYCTGSVQAMWSYGTGHCVH